MSQTITTPTTLWENSIKTLNKQPSYAWSNRTQKAWRISIGEQPKLISITIDDPISPMILISRAGHFRNPLCLIKRIRCLPDINNKTKTG